jgi:CubicO group peptidase (beta-lactamase class C family)
MRFMRTDEKKRLFIGSGACLMQGFIGWVLLVFLLRTVSCDRRPNPVSDHDAFPPAGAQNMDEGLLSAACSEAAGVPGMKSLLVSRNGVTVVERYFNGQGPDSLHDVRSVTKSVMSMLIGIAIDRGFLPDVDRPIGEYLEPVVGPLDPDKAAITIRHLLTMSGGFGWAEFGDWSEYNRWTQAPDQAAYVLNKPLIHAPGTVFNYNDGACHLLSVVLTQAAGMSTLDFANRYLFGPLGIGPRPWARDKAGFYKGCVALELTGRDMIKLGNLFLRHGTSGGGERIVSAEWVALSTRPQIRTGLDVPYGSRYGFLWWIDSANSRNFYYANGYGGQFIFIVPESNLCVAAACDWRSAGNRADEHWFAVVSLIVNDVLPAAR